MEKFYFNNVLCNLFEVDYYKKGEILTIHKEAIEKYATKFWDNEHLDNLSNLPNTTLNFENTGYGWFKIIP